MSKTRRVAFSGAEVIIYDASLPPVVKFCGTVRSRNSETRTLECRARGVEVSDVQLTMQYVADLQNLLHSRGFKPMSANLMDLQIQRRVVELLLTWAALEPTKNPLLAVDVLDPKTLQSAQLATKQLESRVDDSYAFGRRFVSISTYVDMLSSEELLAVAQERALELPTLNKKQRASVKAKDRELVGHFGTAEGRPLKKLTLKQLVMEAKIRGLLGPEGKDLKGKKSKRAWVDLLRPVMLNEVKAKKIREQQDSILREKLVHRLEQEKEEQQKLRVIELIHEMIEQSNDKIQASEPEIDVAPLDQEKSMAQVKARNFLKALVKTVYVCKDTQEDIVVKD